MHRRCHTNCARFVSPRCMPGFVLRDPAERVVGRVKVILAMMNVSIHRKADQSVIGAHGTGREMRRRGDELLVRMSKFFRDGQAATLLPPSCVFSRPSPCPFRLPVNTANIRCRRAGGGGACGIRAINALWHDLSYFQQHESNMRNCLMVYFQQ